MRLRIVRLGTALLVLASMLCARSYAQTAQATLNGEVFDTQHAAIAGATVTITSTATAARREMQTNVEGAFRFDGLPPDTYSLHVDRQGFASQDTQNIALHTADQVDVAITLKVGSASETVTVNGTPLTNDSPAVSLTVTSEFIEDMPLNGRSLQDLIQLAPGTISTFALGRYSIDGQRPDANNYTVDGVSANLGGINNNATAGGAGAGLSGNSPAQTALGTTQSLASVDALQEFTIQTSGYVAEYGRTPGGQVQFTTRSGTNDFHGQAYDYFRNTVMDANSWKDDLLHLAKPPEHQNDFGGTFGGPIRIPKLYDGRNKTFFFFSYEGLRLLLPVAEDEYVPTAAFRRAVAPGIRPVMNAFPLPNSPDSAPDGCTVIDPSTGQPAACDQPYIHGFSQPNSLDAVSARIDQDFGGRFHAFLRFSSTPSSSFVGTKQEEGFDHTTTTRTWTAGLTTDVSKSLVNDFRFNYSYDGEQNITVQQSVNGSVPLPSSFLIPSQYNTGPAASGTYVFEDEADGLNLFGELDPGGAISNLHQYQFVDGLSWTKGSHGIKFGVDYRRIVPTYANETYFSFYESQSLSDIENGIATFGSVSASAPGKPVFNNLSFYVQDHWTLTPRLSIDYGVRWEFNPPPGASDGQYPASLSSNNFSTALIVDNVQPYAATYNHFAPRIGLAWNALGSQGHPLVVRGGYGIFYDTAQSTIGNAYADRPPFTATGPEYDEVPFPLTATELATPPITSAITPPYDAAFIGLTASNLTLPYTEQWNLSIDQSLTSTNTFTASYVGNAGRKLLFNSIVKPVGNPAFAAGSEFDLATNQAQSKYEALQLQDRGRIVNGLDVVGSFTWSHALDNASNDYGSFAPLWGNSDNDIRRTFNVALNYEIPGNNHNSWTRALTSGWLIANRFTAQSGLPLEVSEATVNLPSGYAQLYTPNIVPGVPIYLHGVAGVPHGYELNRAAFACTTSGATSGRCTGTPTVQGNEGRNQLRNLGFFVLNSSLERNFALREKLGLKFRVDAFNILNHPSPYGPNTTLSSTLFGQLAGSVQFIGSSNALYAMGAARSLQLSLKLQF